MLWRADDVHSEIYHSFRPVDGRYTESLVAKPVAAVHYVEATQPRMSDPKPQFHSIQRNP